MSQPHLTADALRDALPGLVEARDGSAVRDLLSGAHPADVAEVLEELSHDAREFVTAALDAGAVADILEASDAEELGQRVEDIAPARLSEVVGALGVLEPEAAADVLGLLSEGRSEEVLEGLAEPQATALAELAEYPPDPAGGIMQPDVLTVLATATAEETIELLRREVEPEAIFYVYVVDEDRGPLG